MAAGSPDGTSDVRSGAAALAVRWCHGLAVLSARLSALKMLAIRPGLALWYYTRIGVYLGVQGFGLMHSVWEEQLRRIRARRRLYQLKHPRRHRLSSGELEAALEKHQMWVGSGWEMGKRADFHRTDLHRAKLQGALLPDADLHSADLCRATLSEADLEGADLHRARLQRAKLDGAELRWADLHEADLQKADLEGAVLQDADLHRAKLCGANLEGADFKGADLRGADLTGTRGLTREQILVANVDARTKLPRDLMPASKGADEA